MNKNNKISIIGYILSLISFLVALFFFYISEIKNYGEMFLVFGGVLLTITSVYKFIANEWKKKS